MNDRKIMKKVADNYRNRVRECRLQYLVARQEDLAKMTEISRTTISALENNRLFLSSHYALVIAEALGCRLDELFQKVGMNYNNRKVDDETRNRFYYESSNK